MRDRTAIRNEVWGGSSMTSRVDQVITTFSEFEPFSVYDKNHCDLIDLRLNQNMLVGAAVSYMGISGERANGETIIKAVMAMIPRVVWPSKPPVGGSGGLVTKYTGITFAAGTSVGVGQVLECYINFGSAMVALGFASFGVILTILDWRARQALNQDDGIAFASYFVIGMSFQQIGGSLTEIGACVAASLVVMALLRSFLRRQAKRKTTPPIPALAS